MNMTQKQMEQLADMVASKIVLELFGDANQRAKAKQDFEDQFFLPFRHVFSALSTWSRV